MYCKNCGEQIDDKAVICVKCGVSTKEKKKKNVTFAFIWSFLIVGVGQCYNGEFGKGVIMFIFTVVFLIISIVTLFEPVISCITWCASALIWIYSMLDAIIIARKINEGE